MITKPRTLEQSMFNELVRKANDMTTLHIGSWVMFHGKPYRVRLFAVDDRYVIAEQWRTHRHTFAPPVSILAADLDGILESAPKGIGR